MANAAPLDGDAFGYHGAVADGTRVILQIRREACSDGMSDEIYEASTELTVGDATYRGCGRFLGE